MLVAFAAAVAGVGHAHEAGGELVAEVALEDAVFDEHGFLGGRAFVVDVERAAACGMVPLSTTVTLELATWLADEAGEGGGLFAVEVGFEAVADGFVQEDAGPAGAEDHFHLSGGCGDGVELEDRLAGGFVGEVLGRLVALEEVELDAAAAAGAAAGVFRPSLAMTKTFKRASGWVSEAKVPSEAAMRMRRSSSE